MLQRSRSGSISKQHQHQQRLNSWLAQRWLAVARGTESWARGTARKKPPRAATATHVRVSSPRSHAHTHTHAGTRPQSHPPARKRSCSRRFNASNLYSHLSSCYVVHTSAHPHLTGPQLRNSSIILSFRGLQLCSVAQSYPKPSARLSTRALLPHAPFFLPFADKRIKPPSATGCGSASRSAVHWRLPHVGKGPVLRCNAHGSYRPAGSRLP